MERQRSFSIKSTRFLILSFTLSSSVLCFAFFSIWVFNYTPSISLDTDLNFNKTVGVQKATDSGVDFSVTRTQAPVLIGAHFNVSGNLSGFAKVSVSVQESESESQEVGKSEAEKPVLENEKSQKVSNETVNVHKVTDSGVDFSDTRTQSPVLIDTHFNVSGNLSGFGEVLVSGQESESETQEVEKSEAEKPVLENEALKSQKVSNETVYVHKVTDSGVDFSDTRTQAPILIDTHFNVSGNLSGFAKISVSVQESESFRGSEALETKEVQKSDAVKPVLENEALKSQKVSNETVDVQKLTDSGIDFSAARTEAPILMDTHFNVSGNLSGFAKISVSDQESESFRGTEALETQQVQKSEAEKLVQENEALKSQKVRFSTNIKEQRGERSLKDCDLEKGKWVYDESYPLYTTRSCPFIDEGFNCEGNGRPDKGYMKWRWQPENCKIPRFNATNMLELIRGKRLVFVGDSINRNQWESMLCMLMGAVKDPKKVYETHGRRITKGKGNYSFKFVDYQCTVEFYVTHHLVHESKARVGLKRVPTLRIDTMDRSSSRWRKADILVFNSAHWWSHYKTKSGVNYYQEGKQVHPKLDVTTAFSRAMNTWASWVDKYIDPHKTQVFFRSSSPSHFSGGQWNSGGHCREATQPLNTTTSSILHSSEKSAIVQDVIRNMTTPVTFLNISVLSGYRIDGHPSIYGRKSRNDKIQDCSHWCLPGVPDSWNELLYLHLQTPRQSRLF